MAQHNPDALNTKTSPYNHREAVKRLGSETLLQKVAFMFLANSPDLMREIEDGISQKSDDIVERSAHTLISSMAYICAEAATAAAVRMEAIGREHRLEEAADAYATLRQEIDLVRGALAEILPEEGVPRES